MEPGRGWRLDRGAFSLMTNYSLLDPESTRPFVVPGDDRLERAGPMLRSFGGRLTVSDAFAVLRAVRQEGVLATRVSFVYAADENAVYYAQNNDFSTSKAFVCRAVTGREGNHGPEQNISPLRRPPDGLSKNVIHAPGIQVGDFTIYNDFVTTAAV